MTFNSPNGSTIITGSRGMSSILNGILLKVENKHKILTDHIHSMGNSFLQYTGFKSLCKVNNQVTERHNSYSIRHCIRVFVAWHGKIVCIWRTRQWTYVLWIEDERHECTIMQSCIHTISLMSQYDWQRFSRWWKWIHVLLRVCIKFPSQLLFCYLVAIYIA